MSCKPTAFPGKQTPSGKVHNTPVKNSRISTQVSRISDQLGQRKMPVTLCITDRLMYPWYTTSVTSAVTGHNSTSEDFGVGRNNRHVNGGCVGRRMLVLSVLLEVHRWHEAFRALDALVASLHQVNLWLGVSVQVRLCHALVVAQSTHVLADSCIARHQHAYVCLLLCFCLSTHHYLVKPNSVAKLQ